MDDDPVSVTSGSDDSPQTGNGSTCEPSPHGKSIKIGGILALFFGVSISAALIAYHDFSAVARGAKRIGGWGLGLILVIQFSGIALNGLGWRALFRSDRQGFTKILIILRWLRESINYLLPVARVGGEVAAVRVLVSRGYDVNTSTAGLVADKTMEVLGLFFFAMAGLIIVFEYDRDSSMEHWAIRALGMVFAILIAFIAAQRWGLLKLVNKVVDRLAGRCGRVHGNDAKSIHDVVWTIYSDKRRLIVAGALHTAGWIPGALQVWVALHYMGHRAGLPGAFIVESLSQVICAAAFIMPAGLGAQEAAYMSVGWWLLGIPPAAGLGLSLVMRLKDVLFGIPGLVAWQFYEGRNLLGLWRVMRNKP